MMASILMTRKDYMGELIFERVDKTVATLEKSSKKNSMKKIARASATHRMECSCRLLALDQYQGTLSAVCS